MQTARLKRISNTRWHGRLILLFVTAPLHRHLRLTDLGINAVLQDLLLAFYCFWRFWKGLHDIAARARLPNRITHNFSLISDDDASKCKCWQTFRKKKLFLLTARKQSLALLWSIHLSFYFFPLWFAKQDCHWRISPIGHCFKEVAPDGCCRLVSVVTLHLIFDHIHWYRLNGLLLSPSRSQI